MPFDWTEERIENLKRLFSERRSAAEIAEKLGGGLSRNAICGKLDRLGITRGLLKIKKQRAPSNRLALGVGPQIQAINRGPEAARPPIRIAHDADDVRPKHIGLLELTNETCRWPYGDQTPFTFCGCQPIARSPYCFAHDERSKPPALQRGVKMRSAA